MPEDEYITAAEAEKRAGLTPRHIARLLQNGTIKGIKPARDWLVLPSAVMEYVSKERRLLDFLVAAAQSAMRGS